MGHLPPVCVPASHNPEVSPRNPPIKHSETIAVAGRCQMTRDWAKPKINYMNKPAKSPIRGLAGGLSGRTLLVSSALLATPLALIAQTAPAPAETPSSAAAADDDVVVLSPFEVVEDTRGYYAANTMSGTRFNTKLEDLASSISVVTKGQMADFAMVDINDVFLYTVGAEGTGTYTDVAIDRNGSASDNVQINPTQANRVRGLMSANVAFNNIEMQNRMPIDPINIDAL